MKKILVLISVLAISGAMFQIGRMSNTAVKNERIIKVSYPSNDAHLVKLSPT